MHGFLANAAANGDSIVSFVGEFILGGIALLAIYVAKWAIDELKKAKDQTIVIMEKSAAERDKTNKENAQAYQRTASATVRVVEQLTQTENIQTEAIRENARESRELRSAVDKLSSTLDGIVRDAVRRRSSDRYPRTRPPESTGGSEG